MMLRKFINENAFGILSARFRIINNTITYPHLKRTDLVMAIIALHNIKSLVDHEDITENHDIPSQWGEVVGNTNNLQTCAKRRASSYKKFGMCSKNKYLM